MTAAKDIEATRREALARVARLEYEIKAAQGLDAVAEVGQRIDAVGKLAQSQPDAAWEARARRFLDPEGKLTPEEVAYAVFISARDQPSKLDSSIPGRSIEETRPKPAPEPEVIPTEYACTEREAAELAALAMDRTLDMGTWASKRARLIASFRSGARRR